LKKSLNLIISTLIIIFQINICYSKDYNLVLLPEAYCHQAGIETRITKNSTLGIIGRANCVSERPTYESKNDDVENAFSRVLLPWKYSFNGSFSKGAFVQGMAGLEKSKFKSISGSSADVTFVNLSMHGGYQWFWRSGFNLSLLGGVAYLQEVSSSKQIVGSERSEVTDFIDKNIKTNVHGGAGVTVGWMF